MKIDIGKILSIGTAVVGLVKRAQAIGGSGVDKHAAVADAAKELLPVIEGIAAEDIADNAAYNAAIDQLIVASKASLKAAEAVKAAQKRVNEVVADIKSRR